MNTTTIGHDSEFALSRNNQILSALDTFEELENEFGRAFPDNLNCEIAINPVNTLKDFHTNTEGLLNTVRDKGFDLIMKPVVIYPEDCLSNPMSKVSGCNPDFSAYMNRENEAPSFEDMDGTRSCGAHVHVSHSQSVSNSNLAIWMDICLALPLLSHEEPSNRRKLYGAPGCLRTKPYGTEYRTLSNVWLDDIIKREFVWENTHKALELAKKHVAKDLDDLHEIFIAITEHDVEMANRCIDRLYIYNIAKL